MSYLKIISLADRFMIKYAADEDEKTNPGGKGGKDAGPPAFVEIQTPLPTAPKPMADPRTPPIRPANLTRLTDPGLQYIPVPQREIVQELFTKTSSTLNRINSDFGTLNEIGYFKKPANVKRKNYYRSMLSRLEVLLRDIPAEPFQAAKKISNLVDENREDIIEYSADIIGFQRDYAYNELNITPGVAIEGPKARGLWHLLKLQHWIQRNLPAY